MFAGMHRPYSKTLDYAIKSRSRTNTLAYFGFFIRDKEIFYETDTWSSDFESSQKYFEVKRN
jgi:hypothetical protein